MIDNLINDIKTYIQNNHTPEYVEVFVDLEPGYYDIYSNNSGLSYEQFCELYKLETGKDIQLVNELITLECEDVMVKEYPFIDIIKTLDAYGSYKFKYHNEIFYVFSNYDEKSLINSTLKNGNHILTSFLILSETEKRFYSFHITLTPNTNEYHIENLSRSRKYSNKFLDIVNQHAFGKRSYHWYLNDNKIILRFDQEGHNKLKKLKFVYKEYLFPIIMKNVQ